MQKFRRIQAQNKVAINKHLEANAYLESSSEDEDDINEEDIQNAVGKVLSAYQGREVDAEKILSYLINIFQSGSAVCLICISTVKRADPVRPTAATKMSLRMQLKWIIQMFQIWNCSKCFAFLHLSCISHWIQDSLSIKRERGIEPVWAW